MSKGNETRKRAGDPAIARFMDLVVEEVSIVDAAANEESFFIIKRRKEMEKKDDVAEVAKDTGKPDELVVDAQTAEQSKSVVENADDATPDLTTLVADGVTAGVKAALEQLSVGRIEDTPDDNSAEVPVQAAEKSDAPETEDAVANLNALISAGFDKLGTRLDALEAAQAKQGEAVAALQVARAVAKGESVPDGLAPVTTPERNESPWAGTAVSRVFGGKR